MSDDNQRPTTDSGHVLKSVYTSADIAGYRHEHEMPGEYPYTRGIWPTMYRSRLWTMRQYAGFGSPLETNKRFKTLLKKGETGLSVAFDLPTQLGYDSDNPLCYGEVGRVGVSIDSLEDMEMLFDGIPMEKVSTSMTINAPAAILLAMYITVASKRGIEWSKLSGTVQNDILKEYVARGTYIFPPEPSLRLTADIIGFCTQNLPRWNPISISGYHMREAGASASQEIAFTFANAIEYVRSVLSRGIQIDAFAPRISFFFSSGIDLLEEVAKFRAARRLWARLMRNEFGSENPRSWILRFHAQTSGSTLTAQEPLNNVTRVTLQALAAVFGGTQSLHTNSMDEAYALPTEESATLALRTQQIIAYESGIVSTVDPLGGSYCIEALTNEMENKAWDYLGKIKEIGGATKAVRLGYIRNEIDENAFKTHKTIEIGEKVIVGLNAFCESNSESNLSIHTIDYTNNSTKDIATENLRNVRQKRNNKRVKKAIEELSKAAHGSGNLMVPMLECVEAYATIGEICDGLRSVFGEYKPS